jgi:hypothetical protein
VKKQPVVDGAPEVAEEALESREVGLLGIVHMETDLLHDVGDVRPSEGEVLKGTDKTPVAGRVATESPVASESLACVSTRVEQGFQSLIWARSRMSRVYYRW